MTTLVRALSVTGAVERGVTATVLGAMALLPIVEIVLRATLHLGVPGSVLIVQHLTFVTTFLGASLAARDGRLLALSTATFLPRRAGGVARWVAHAVGAAVAFGLCLAALQFVRVEWQHGPEVVPGVPAWVVIAVMPVALAAIAVRLTLEASPGWRRRSAAAVSLLMPLALTQVGPDAWGRLAPPLLLVVLGATALGLPIFAAIGGAAMLLFLGSGVPAATVPVNTYTLTTFPALPAVPLFTLAGAVLGAGRASDRLVRVATALVGWMPGGAAVATTLAFAFFTSFTGASGVTILSLGGLMLPVLVRAGYSASFAIGLVTVAGSIGLLLPPSLPVILYGVYAQQRVDHMLLGGLGPGLLLVVAVVVLAAREGVAQGIPRSAFHPGEALAAVREASWELALPVIVLVGLFSGATTMVEAASVTACYAVAVSCWIRRDLSISRDLPRVLTECASLVGAFLIILGVALALTDYLLFEGWPTRALEMVQARIESPLVFLLALNLFLLGVGALMDIYSAIFVVVPLIAPMAAAYGIDPVHLGIVFLTNLELGYLTPPMGENLFLSATRFDVPVLRVFRHAWPFYAAIACCVLIVTYVPGLTLAPLAWLTR